MLEFFRDNPHCQRQSRRIYLTGFMACGKSIIGRLLAHKLGYAFFDSDQIIETRTGKSVAEIFAKDGEDCFRQMEQQTLQKLSLQDRTVIALGGGVVLNHFNRQILKRAQWVFLDTPLPVIHQRLVNDTKRPLVQAGTDALTQLYQTRLWLYQEAPIHVSCGQKSPLAIVKQLSYRLHQFSSDRIYP